MCPTLHVHPGTVGLGTPAVGVFVINPGTTEVLYSPAVNVDPAARGDALRSRRTGLGAPSHAEALSVAVPWIALVTGPRSDGPLESLWTGDLTVGRYRLFRETSAGTLLGDLAVIEGAPTAVDLWPTSERLQCLTRAVPWGEPSVVTVAAVPGDRPTNSARAGGPGGR